jgi:hypothetical protein
MQAKRSPEEMRDVPWEEQLTRFGLEARRFSTERLKVQATAYLGSSYPSEEDSSR